MTIMRRAATAAAAAAAAVFGVVFVVLPGSATASDADADRPQRRQRQRRRPNVIFILAEDMGHGDLPCYGHPYGLAPNLCSRLASRGTLYRQFYASGATCEPSRTGFMTGLDPPAFPNDVADFGLPDGLPTVTNLLRDWGGYVTGHVGKFHIGPEDDGGLAAASRYGIDHVKVMYGVRDGSHPGGKDDAIYDAAVDFIRSHHHAARSSAASASDTDVNDDGDGDRQPFYLNVWGHISHSPVDPHPAMVRQFLSARGSNVTVNRADFTGPDVQSKFDLLQSMGADTNESMTNYLSEIYSMDLAIGKVLNVLDELGIANDTIVAFATDHGQADIDPNSQSTPLNMMGYAGGLRGSKHGFYEGGVRVPFVIRWPGHIPAGVVNDRSVMSAVDWLPTVCSLAGVPVDSDSDSSAGTTFVGEDLSDVWLGDNGGGGDGGGGAPQRSRSNPLHWRTSNPNGDVAMLWGRWKFHVRRKGVKKSEGGERYELYDLATDRMESINLYMADGYRTVSDRLRKHLELWEGTLPDSYCKLKRGCEEPYPFDYKQAKPGVLGPPQGVDFDEGPLVPPPESKPEPSLPPTTLPPSPRPAPSPPPPAAASAGSPPPSPPSAQGVPGAAPSSVDLGTVPVRSAPAAAALSEQQSEEAHQAAANQEPSRPPTPGGGPTTTSASGPARGSSQAAAAPAGQPADRAGTYRGSVSDASAASGHGRAARGGGWLGLVVAGGLWFSFKGL